SGVSCLTTSRQMQSSRRLQLVTSAKVIRRLVPPPVMVSRSPPSTTRTQYSAGSTPVSPSYLLLTLFRPGRLHLCLSQATLVYQPHHQQVLLVNLIFFSVS